MIRRPALKAMICYSGIQGATQWEGRQVPDPTHFQHFLREVVHPRLTDAETSFTPDLQALATTGMASEFLGQFLAATPTPESWDIGEAFAECVLQHESGHDIRWPWNTVRDRRTPRASLPGADLVGFHLDGEDVQLLFGEVKTSSDPKTPPGVMTGSGGMAWQLEQNATALHIQHSLLKWLHARCQTPDLQPLFKSAVSRYLQSGGKALLLIGVLIRDTTPNELDLKNRGLALAEKLPAPTRTWLHAWYLPVPIPQWPALLQEPGP